MMRRWPEIIVLLVLPAVGIAVYDVQQCLLLDYGQRFHLYAPEVVHDEEARHRLWASPPGPFRDVVKAGVPGWAMAGLGVLLAACVATSLTGRVRSGTGRRICLRIAVLASLLAVAAGPAGLAALRQEFYQFPGTAVDLIDRLAPGLAALRLGALLSMAGVTAYVLLGVLALDRTGSRR